VSSRRRDTMPWQASCTSSLNDFTIPILGQNNSFKIRIQHYSTPVPTIRELNYFPEKEKGTRDAPALLKLLPLQKNVLENLRFEIRRTTKGISKELFIEKPNTAN
jgi:hypothetical protein